MRIWRIKVVWRQCRVLWSVELRFCAEYFVVLWLTVIRLTSGECLVDF